MVFPCDSCNPPLEGEELSECENRVVNGARRLRDSRIREAVEPAQQAMQMALDEFLAAVNAQMDRGRLDYNGFNLLAALIDGSNNAHNALLDPEGDQTLADLQQFIFEGWGGGFFAGTFLAGAGAIANGQLTRAHISVNRILSAVEAFALRAGNAIRVPSELSSLVIVMPGRAGQRTYGILSNFDSGPTNLEGYLRSAFASSQMSSSLTYRTLGSLGPSIPEQAVSTWYAELITGGSAIGGLLNFGSEANNWDVRPMGALSEDSYAPPDTNVPILDIASIQASVDEAVAEYQQALLEIEAEFCDAECSDEQRSDCNQMSLDTGIVHRLNDDCECVDTTCTQDDIDRCANFVDPTLRIVIPGLVPEPGNCSNCVKPTDPCANIPLELQPTCGPNEVLSKDCTQCEDDPDARCVTVPCPEGQQFNDDPTVCECEDIPTVQCDPQAVIDCSLRLGTAVVIDGECVCVEPPEPEDVIDPCEDETPCPQGQQFNADCECINSPCVSGTELARICSARNDEEGLPDNVSFVWNDQNGTPPCQCVRIEVETDTGTGTETETETVVDEEKECGEGTELVEGFEECLPVLALCQSRDTSGNPVNLTCDSDETVDETTCKCIKLPCPPGSSRNADGDCVTTGGVIVVPVNPCSGITPAPCHILVARGSECVQVSSCPSGYNCVNNRCTPPPVEPGADLGNGLIAPSRRCPRGFRLVGEVCEYVGPPCVDVLVSTDVDSTEEPPLEALFGAQEPAVVVLPPISV